MKTFRCIANQGDDDDSIVKHKLATTAVRERKGKLDYWAICGDSTNGAVPNAEVKKAYQTDLSCTVPTNRTSLREKHRSGDI
ncbi:hypothetical protein EMCRGX_G004475 [Ephydatia muelleri]